MEEKITIKRINNSCDLMHPETHSVGANLYSYGSDACTIVFPEHKKDELGNFNAAAREAFKEYLKDKDLTPRSKRLYSGAILFVDPKHEDNTCFYGTSWLGVTDGLIPDLLLKATAQNLRIEVGMSCSELTERISDMYFYDKTWSKRNKVMYLDNRV